ncbi:uncharacterized protein LOC111289044 [Durio zibethinus]|uniref:Uncharacterized protein LOC111289044 n=1 Tax=Durio zibethinus TaxID=66656 RepID=A0A6P5Y6P1_DURZI|nr:uncharacterized protein LOC111289044 [Durio zibethinus]
MVRILFLVLNDGYLVFFLVIDVIRLSSCDILMRTACIASWVNINLLKLLPFHEFNSFTVGSGLYVKNKTDWLSSLLQNKFFGPCSDHQELRKYEKNMFCIDCSLEFCRHCEAHSQHRSIQICKYVYQDVVRLQEMQKHLDCSKIQTYKVNGERAVHLLPRPQAKDAKPSTKSKAAAACEGCGRYLQDPPNQFCSIACKVSAFDVKPTDQSDEMELPIQELPDLSSRDNQNSEVSTEAKQSSISSTDVSETKTLVNTSLRPRKRVNKRKGIPRRAPYS